MGFSLGICEMFVWKIEINNIHFEVFIVEIIQTVVSGVVKLCTLVSRYQYFRETHCLPSLVLREVCRVRNWLFLLSGKKYCGAEDSCFPAHHFYLLRPGSCRSGSPLPCNLHNQTDSSLYILNIHQQDYIVSKPRKLQPEKSVISGYIIM
jgi:hypothetical protein